MSSAKKAPLDCNPIPAQNYYDFGQKSAALIGLLLTSNGKVTAFAYERPALDPTKPLEPMKEVFRSAPLKLQTGTVPFTLSLAPKRTGLLTLEPLGWTYAYELNRTHFLGNFNPFGADEIPFGAYSERDRREDIPANRVFKGVYIYDPKAEIKDQAVLTLTDVESEGQGTEIVSISSMASPDDGVAGGVFVAIRVNVANYHDVCATLDFTGGHVVEIASGPTSRLELKGPPEKKKSH